jgi:hypothetical protein
MCTIWDVPDKSPASVHSPILPVVFDKPPRCGFMGLRTLPGRRSAMTISPKAPSGPAQIPGLGCRSLTSPLKKYEPEDTLLESRGCRLASQICPLMCCSSVGSIPKKGVQTYLQRVLSIHEGAGLFPTVSWKCSYREVRCLHLSSCRNSLAGSQSPFLPSG